MPGLDLVVSAPVLAGVLAYGPVPGGELIPYFLGLLAWAGLAIGAILLSPFTALLRWLRRTKDTPQPALKSEPLTAPVPESQGEGSPDRA